MEYLHGSINLPDEKITELYDNYGYEGLGLFYSVIRKLAHSEKPIRTDILKKKLSVGKRLNRCWEYMESIDLITASNGETFNVSIRNHIQKKQLQKVKNAQRVSQWRKNQTIEKTQPKKNKKDLTQNIYSDDVKNFTAKLSKYFPKTVVAKLTRAKKYEWIDTVEKLLTVDKYTKAEIEKAVINGRNDILWAKNFLTLKKLRMPNAKQECAHIVIFLNLGKTNENIKKSNYKVL